MKRKYDNTLRLERTEAISQKVIETLVELLIETRGGDVAFREISKKSKVPLRTIFRLFKDKDALYTATDRYLMQFVSASASELSKLDLLSFVRNTYSIYDKYENLVMAYLFSSFGRQARDVFRGKFNKLLLEQIAKERQVKRGTGAPGKLIDAKLAFTVSLVNAKLWYDIKTDAGLSGKQIGEVAAWAINCLLTDIEKNR